MSRTEPPLIVGAGPVGLAAALFLTKWGRLVRVVEVKTEPSRESRALAINPRTLELLESAGLSQQILDLGLRIRGVDFYRRGKLAGSFNFDGLHPRYPFMLALSQATTERLLAKAFLAAGGQVERGVRLVHCVNVEDGVEAGLEHADSSRETVHCPWLLAADGAHSTARESLHIGFPGSALPGDWHLADTPLETSLPEDRAHAFFFDADGFLFLIRVVDDMQPKQAAGAIWRVITTRPNPLAQLLAAKPAGAPVWQSSFRVSHRLVPTMQEGNVYFAGDAAHVHSPIGARGMNLGLEDAWVFADLATIDRLSDYHAVRHPVDRQVVRRVRRLSENLSGRTRPNRFLRAALLSTLAKVPFVRTRMMRTLTGLDHELPG